MTSPEPEIEAFTASDHKDAERSVRKVDALINAIKTGEASLVKDYARLGSVLLHIRQKKLWLLLDDGAYKSFPTYIDTIKTKIEKGRTQLYAAISTAERLLPFIDEAQLAEMGISKATTLASYVKQTGVAPSVELVAKATDSGVGVEDFRMICYAAQNAAPPEPGQWMDMGGCYFTAGEREEWMRACKVAMITDPPIAVDLRDHMKKKEIFLRFAREYLSTHEATVMGRRA